MHASVKCIGDNSLQANDEITTVVLSDISCMLGTQKTDF